MSQHVYISYLLRLWQVQRGGEQVWYASLESPHTAEQYHFSDLADLFAFLTAQTTAITGPPDPSQDQAQDP